MAQSNKIPASVRGLLTLNMLLHVISGIFTGVWISNLVAPSGNMTMLSWVETILSAVAIATGLSYGSFIALMHIPTLPQPKRGKAMGIFISAYAGFALLLGIASSSVLASPAGEVAHMEAYVVAMTDATQVRRQAAASIINRVPALNDCYGMADSMAGQETGSGTYSGEGGNVGRVATALANIRDGCGNARAAIYASRAKLSRLFFRIDRLLLDTRRVIDSDLERHAKLVAVRKNGDEFGRLTREVNDALAVEAMQTVADAMRKDWHAAGLPASAAAAITQNFDGLAEELTEGLDDIAALKNAPIPSMPVVSNMAYLALYPQATIAAIAIGACIELIPLGGILLGFAIMSSNEGGGEGGRLPAAPVPSVAVNDNPTGSRRGRPPGKQTKKAKAA